MIFKIIEDNLVQLKTPVDAIVNSANPFMSRGGGICGAIHIAAGFAFTEYCVAKGNLRVGECKLTPAFNLPYEYVIHTLSPIYKRYDNPEQILVAVYKNVFSFSHEHNIKIIACPLLGAGHHGYPIELSIRCAIKAAEELSTINITLIMVCTKEEDKNIGEQLYNDSQLHKKN